MTAPLAFVDTETTGLDPDLHEIWDVGLILRKDGTETVCEWRLPVDLSRADAFALNLGRFHERHRAGCFTDEDLEAIPPTIQPQHFAREFAKLTWGTHLVSNVVSFDEERLRKLLRANGQCPGWHYHLVDVEAMVAGHLGIEPPWKSDELSLAVGVESPGEGVLHTALGDAHWAMEMYDAVIARGV